MPPVSLQTTAAKQLSDLEIAQCIAAGDRQVLTRAYIKRANESSLCR